MLAVGITLSLSAMAQTNSQTTLPVEPMSPMPTFRVTVISRSVQAVNYKHRSVMLANVISGRAKLIRRGVRETGDLFTTR